MRPSGKSFPVIFFVLSDLLTIFLALVSLSHLSKSPVEFKELNIQFIYWLTLFAISGRYQDLYHKSRLMELVHTLITISVGVLIITLLPFLTETDSTHVYSFDYLIKASLIFFGWVMAGRLLLLSHLKNQIINHKVSFNTLLVGRTDDCLRLFEEYESGLRDSGYQCVGYLNMESDNDSAETFNIPRLGSWNDLELIINKNQVRMVILAPDKKSVDWIEPTIERLMSLEVQIRLVPDMLDILSGSVKTNSVLGTPLVEIYAARMPSWQRNIKRLMDFAVALMGSMLAFPIFLWIAWRVKKSGDGPILFKQERIGRKGKPFLLYKFRSMIHPAESDGPALSSENDPRITPIGKTLRKWRLDELPQLWNILIGEMSFVGPRPERKHYIDQIVRIHPYYRFLLQVKPGLTSWGMVQFGYAENIPEMIERSRYDLLYLENLSLLLDLKILLHTLRIVWMGKGK